MLLGLDLRVCWSCLLLLSGAACFPATGGYLYRYPYMPSGGSSGGPAPGSGLQAEGPHKPLVSLQYEASGPAVNQFPPGAARPSQGESGFNRPPIAPAAPAWGPVTTGASRAESGFNRPPIAPAAPAWGPVTTGASRGESGFNRPPIAPAAPAWGPVTTGASRGESGFNRPPIAPAAPAWGPVTTGASGVGSGVAFSPAYEAPSAGFVSPAEPAGNPAAAHVLVGPAAYAAEPSGSAGFGPGLPWAEPAAWGPGPSSFDPSRWMPSRAFPDFSVWESGVAAKASQGGSEAASSYIIQSSNGYQRAREDLSHSRYSPEYPEPPVWAPSKSAAAPGSKGGLKV